MPVPAPPAHTTRPSPASAVLPSAAAPARIEARQYQIRQQIRRDHCRRVEQSDGQNHRMIALRHRTEKQFAKLKQRAEELEIRATWIGTVGGETLRIALGPDVLTDIPISQLAEVSQNAIPRRMIR